MAIKHNTDRSGRNVAANPSCLSPFVYAIIQPTFVLYSTGDIERFLLLRISIALYTFVCRPSTLGTLSALLAGLALSSDMRLSLHLPIATHCSLKSARLVDDRPFSGPSNRPPKVAWRWPSLRCCYSLWPYLSPSLHCFSHHSLKCNIGKPIPKIVELVGRECSSCLQLVLAARGANTHPKCTRCK